MSESGVSWAKWRDGEHSQSEAKKFARADWLGARADLVDGKNRAATIVWEWTRDRCCSGTQNDMRQLLSEIEPSLQIYGHGSASQRILASLYKEPSDNRLGRAKSLLLVQFLLARIALMIRLNDLKFNNELAAHFRTALSRLAVDRDEGIEVCVPANFNSTLQAYFSEMLSGTASSHRDNPVVLQAIFQIEHAIHWLLGNKQSSACKSLIVPFHVAGSNLGSLAFLEMESMVAPLASQYAPGTRVAPDLVSQGLMLFDDSWQQAFQNAASWAEKSAVRATGNDKKMSFVYRLRFAFSHLAPSCRDASLLGRPLLVEKGSASLGAGILMRAHLEQVDVSHTWCVTGAITSRAEGHLAGTISYCLPKFDAYEELIRKRRLASNRMIIGHATTEDVAQLETLQKLSVLENATYVESIDQAYRLAKGWTSSFACYIEVERDRIWRSVNAFCPSRIEDSLKSEDTHSTGPMKLELLDQINMKQVGERPVREAREKPNEPDAPKTESLPLDELIDQFFHDQLSDRRVLKIVGGPGMGKTWIGHRWHLKLLARYWNQLSGSGNSAIELASFPVWVSAYELGLALKKTPRIEQALCNIICRRLRNKISEKETLKQFRRELARCIGSRQVFLIVDAWDERHRGHEQSLKTALASWSWKNKLIITSRIVGESILTTDPLWFIEGRNLPWTVQIQTGESSFELFARNWFGDTVTDHQPILQRLNMDWQFRDLNTTPQLAAIVCWLIERNAWPTECSRAAHLLEQAIESVLRKRIETYRANGHHHFASGIEDGSVLQLLQLLAYQSFEGTRWNFSNAKLCKDLSQDCYHTGQVAELHQDKISLASLLLQTGLFTQTSRNRFEIVHQALAEVLVAGHLVANYKPFESTETTNMIQEAASHGMFETRWINVWKYYASMSDHTEEFLTGLLKLSADTAALSLQHSQNCSSLAKRLALEVASVADLSETLIGFVSTECLPKVLEQVSRPFGANSVEKMAEFPPSINLLAQLSTKSHISNILQDPEWVSDSLENISQVTKRYLLSLAGVLDAEDLWELYEYCFDHRHERDPHYTILNALWDIITNTSEHQLVEVLNQRVSQSSSVNGIASYCKWLLCIRSSSLPNATKIFLHYWRMLKLDYLANVVPAEIDVYNNSDMIVITVRDILYHIDLYCRYMLEMPEHLDTNARHAMATLWQEVRAFNCHRTVAKSWTEFFGDDDFLATFHLDALHDGNHSGELKLTALQLKEVVSEKDILRSLAGIEVSLMRLFNREIDADDLAWFEELSLKVPRRIIARGLRRPRKRKPIDSLSSKQVVIRPVEPYLNGCWRELASLLAGLAIIEFAEERQSYWSECSEDDSMLSRWKGVYRLSDLGQRLPVYKVNEEDSHRLREEWLQRFSEPEIPELGGKFQVFESFDHEKHRAGLISSLETEEHGLAVATALVWLEESQSPWLWPDPELDSYMVPTISQVLAKTGIVFVDDRRVLSTPKGTLSQKRDRAPEIVAIDTASIKLELNPLARFVRREGIPEYFREYYRLHRSRQW